MKKILRKEVIVAFIIGIILASVIVYAATSAREVTYTTNKNGEVQTVADALNDLYNNKKFSEIINIYAYDNAIGTQGKIFTSDGEIVSYNKGGTQKTDVQWDSSTTKWTVTAKTSGTYVVIYPRNSSKYTEIKYNKDDEIIKDVTDNDLRVHGSIIVIRID